MKYFKIVLKVLLLIFITSFIIINLSYFGIINDKAKELLNDIQILISIFIGSFILGLQSNNKGYLNGIKLGFIFDLIFIIMRLLLRKKFDFLILIFYILILLISILGSILGINKKMKASK